MERKSCRDTGREVDRMLVELQRSSAVPLPGNFSSGVLRKAREFRRALRRHWRILAWASLAALLLSALVGFRLAEVRADSSVPPLRIFHAADESAPFVAR